MEREGLVAQGAGLNAQWDGEAFGMIQYTGGWCDYLVSWIIFLVLAPLLLVLWLPASLVTCSHPVLVENRFAGWLLSGGYPGRSYLGHLLLRLCGFCDLVLNAAAFFRTSSQRMWIDTIDPAEAAYYDKLLGRNVVLWHSLRIGDYKQARELILDPTRRRTRALDGWISGFARDEPNMPIFFNTGSPYHSAWRDTFITSIAGRDSIKKALENDGAGLAEMVKPILDHWLQGIFLREASDLSKYAFPVAPMVLFLLYEVEYRSMSADLLKAIEDFVSVGAAYVLLPPWLLPSPLKSYTKAWSMVRDLLLHHCNAKNPEALKGKAFDWASLAARLPGFLPKPGVAQEPQEAFVDVLAGMTVVAAVTGATNAFMSVFKKFVDISFTPSPTGSSTWPAKEPQWVPDIDKMVSLYRRSPIDFILEALRLGVPVAGTHQVLESETRCPFLHGEVAFPRGTVLCANLNACHTDPGEWGADALDFRPGRAPRDRYLIWNGPFGAETTAPRQCPGEQLAVHVIKAALDAFLAKWRGPVGNDESLSFGVTSCCR